MAKKKVAKAPPPEDEVVEQGDTIETIELVTLADQPTAETDNKSIRIDGNLLTIDDAFRLGLVNPHEHPELFDDFGNRK